MTKPDDLVGKQLGDYTLQRKLTRGGMSQIYLGIDERLQRKAAIKVLTPELAAGDDTMTERFQREARAIAALEHDNIITIYQYGDVPDLGTYFIAMRFIDGHDLADELNALHRQGQRLGINRALKLLEQIAAALDFAHAAGVIHRDIKPSNFLIDKNDKAYLSDFGLVLRQAVDQTLGTAFGTPRYISPEQATDSQLAVTQSDIYSLGVVVYEILTGQSPFTGKTPMEMALSHISDTPRPPRDLNPAIPEAVNREVLRALEKDPDRRHKTAGEFIRALRRGYNMDSAAARSASADTLPAPPRKAEPTPVMAETEIKEAIQEIQREKVTAPPANPTPLFTSTHPGIDTKIIDPSISAKPPSKKKRSRLAPVLLLLAAIGIIGGGGLIASGAVPAIFDPQAATQAVELTGEGQLVALTEETTQESPTATLTATTPSPAASTQTSAEATPDSGAALNGEGGDSATILLQYNALAFSIRNETDSALDISRLQFVRGEGGTEDDFAGAEVPGGVLEPGECALIASSSPGVEVPAEWDCAAERSRTVRPTELLFWRVDSEGSAEFKVQQGDTILGTCASIARTGSDLCTIIMD